MSITYDVAKNEVNTVKHGVSLALATELEWDTLLSMPDTRRQYGEVRHIGYVLHGTRLYCVVFTDRGDDRRIISLRKANEREVRRYANQI